MEGERARTYENKTCTCQSELTHAHIRKCEQKKNQLRSLRICSLAPTSGFSCSVHPKYGYAHSAHCIIFGYIRSTFNASKGDAWHETKKQTKKRNFSHKNCFQLLVHQKIHIISADYILNRCKVFSGYYCSCSVFLFYIWCRSSISPSRCVPFYTLFAHPAHCFSFITLIISPLCNNI